MAAATGCGALTVSGRPCRRKAVEGGRCGQHASAEPVTLSEAVASGDRRKALEALRDRLAAEVERVADEGFCTACKRGSSSVAPLAKQLRDVVDALDGMPQSEGKSVVDDLASRRAARRAAAAGPA